MKKLPLINFSKPQKNLGGATAVIFNKAKNKILLAKRRDLPVWVTPGGMIEDGELPEQAVLREVFEETGVKAKIVRKVAEYFKKNSQKKIYLFECKIISGKPSPQLESKEVRFWDYKKLPELIDPRVHIYLRDSLLAKKTLIKRNLPSIKSFLDKKFIIKHPFIAFRYKLMKLGIHINI